MRRFFALLLVLAALTPAFAASARESGERRDHDAARKAFELGEVQPLSQILKTVQNVAPGEVLEVELERSDGRLVYEIDVLERSGRVLEIIIDARTGSVLSVENED